MQRCPWAKGERYEVYHDEEWGVPIRHDLQRGDRSGLFEFLILEGAQAGLSWSTILNKREHYREAFEGFDPERIARFTPARIEKLLAVPRARGRAGSGARTGAAPPGIVRNRLKVHAAVTNARAYLALGEEIGGADPLAAFLWGFADPSGAMRPVQNRWTGMGKSRVPATTPVSDAMSKALAKRGFKFVGSTIMYAFMQATGMVNDHLVMCPRHAALARSK